MTHKGQHVYVKIISITNHQGNTNQSRRDKLTSISMTYITKKTAKTDADAEKQGLLSAVGEKTSKNSIKPLKKPHYWVYMPPKLNQLIKRYLCSHV